MDTTGFFDYPTEPSSSAPSTACPASSSDRGEDDWAMLLDHTETRLLPRRARSCSPQGERDRALYLLVDGWLQRAERRRSTRSRRSARPRSSTAARAR